MDMFDSDIHIDEIPTWFLFNTMTQTNTSWIPNIPRFEAGLAYFFRLPSTLGLFSKLLKSSTNS